MSLSCPKTSRIPIQDYRYDAVAYSLDKTYLSYMAPLAVVRYAHRYSYIYGYAGNLSQYLWYAVCTARRANRHFLPLDNGHELDILCQVKTASLIKKPFYLANLLISGIIILLCILVTLILQSVRRTAVMSQEIPMKKLKRNPEMRRGTSSTESGAPLGECRLCACARLIKKYVTSFAH